jgi:hypothetical protein
LSELKSKSIKGVGRSKKYRRSKEEVKKKYRRSQ